jgi:D-alanyl-D-alanine carboxypeptidase
MVNRRLPLFFMIIAMVISTTPARANNDPSRPPLVGGPAVAFLKSLPRQWSHSSARDCKTYEDKNIDKLAAPFATSAAAFLEAYRRQYGEVTITSAYRTSKEQICVCQGEKGPCAGRPHTVKTKGGRRIVVRGISRHQLGIALDVRPGMGSEEEYRCLHKFASLNPQFGIYFPLGSRDYPHMERRSPEFHHSRAAMPASTELTACSKRNASFAPRAQ